MDSEKLIQGLIDFYELEPHPEGGYFKETYRAKGMIVKDTLGSEFTGSRNYSTAIYFLIPEGKKSKLHRLRSDEVWHFYLGGPLVVAQIFPDGRAQEVVLGPDFRKGQWLQHVVLAGCWFGSYPQDGSSYSFVGCTVAPGFDFADFEMGKREDLLRQFPQAEESILRLTDF